jgi:glycosyltransferase involved in cell wall biosynthesis
MRRFEPRVMRNFDRVLVSSPADRDALERGGKNGVAVIPNGVDAAYFAFHEAPRENDTIVFLGKMSYYVNVAAVQWFCRQVLPLIWRQRPNARFRIVGRDPVREITALAGKGIEVTGTVPDVRPHLASAAVSVCPMVTGSGIQNKMLEAMAVGAPTVSTTIACQALSVEPGRDVLVADTPEAFADCVVRLLNDGELRRRVAANARRYVEQHHDWRAIGCRLEEIYDGLLSGNQTSQHRTV